MTRNIRSTLKRWKESLENTYDKSEFNIVAGSWISLIGSPLYYIINTQITNLEYENIYYRVFNMLFCLPLLSVRFYPRKYQSLITLYWYIWIVVTVAGFFTFMTFMNDFSVAWIVAETIMIFIVVMLLGELKSIIVVLLSSVFFGLFIYFLRTNSLPEINRQFIEFVSLLPVAFICGFLFHFNSKKGEIRVQKQIQAELEEKNKLLKALAGSIAHEVRNPLNTINIINSQINDSLRNLDNEIMEIVNKAGPLGKGDDK